MSDRLPFALFLLLLPVVQAFSADAEDELISYLSKGQPTELRKAAAESLGKLRSVPAIKPLINCLSDDDPVRRQAATALTQITGRDFGPKDFDKQTWDGWWSSEGRKTYGDARAPILASPTATPAPGGGDTASLISTSKDLLAWTAISIGMASLLLLVGFGIFAGYRLKQIKEVLRRAEKYVADAEEVARNSDKVVSTLDAKRAEIMSFFDQKKEDHQGEIERFADLLEQNVEHRMREVTMGLREKAEKEIEGTLAQLKEDVSREVKRATEDQKQRILDEFALREKTFMNDVEAHTLFLEASFHYISGKHEEALKLYKRLLVLKPDHWVAWNNKGTVLREMGRTEEALEAYAKALDLSPDNAGVHYNVAATYARVRKRDKMLETLRRAVASDSQYSDEALNDPAFREYWADASFKEVAEA